MKGRSINWINYAEGRRRYRAGDQRWAGIPSGARWHDAFRSVDARPCLSVISTISRATQHPYTRHGLSDLYSGPCAEGTMQDI